MTTQKMLSELRKTINVFGMIKDGDRIAVGLSGGKDSLAMLYLLHRYAMFSPQRFSLVAITIDMGLGSDFSGLTSFCKSINTEHVIVATEIGKIVFDVRKEPNPCSLCANMRRGALNNTAVKVGCNKIALGHHADDLIETLFLSLFYESRLSTFSPVTHLERKNVTVIRPMIYIREKEISGFIKGKPILHNPCPANKHTKRQYIKDLLKTLEKDNKKIKENVLGAITHPERNGLFSVINREEKDDEGNK